MDVRAGRLRRFRLPGVVATWLPQGGALDAAAWAARHRGICVLLRCHVLVLPLIVVLRGHSLWHGLAEAAVVTWLAVLAECRGLGARSRSASATLGLLVSSAVVVHLFHGVIEAHFHFFVIVAVVALYQAWLPFLLALAFVLVHHSVVGLLVPQAVYNHEAAIRNPLLWGLIHGSFILAESIACLVYWRASEQAVSLERKVRISAEIAHRDLADAQELAGIGSWDWNVASDAVTWSDQFYDLAGLDKVTFTPSVDSYLQLIHPDDRERIASLIRTSLQSAAMLDYECRVLRSDGEVRTIHALGNNVTDGGGTVVRMKGTIHDITERRRLEGVIAQMAYADSLTGLANRRAADERLEAWASNPTDALQLTVVLCDVNGLKTVNDTHGHLVGDRLIEQVGAYASAAAARLPHGIAARIGGDEFLIAGPCGDQDLVHDVVEELAEAASRLPYGDGLSCGSAWAGDLIRPEPSSQALVRSLLRMADAEQYRHKHSTRTGLRVRPEHGTGRTWRDAPAPALTSATPGAGRRRDEHPAEELVGHGSVQQRLEHAAHVVSTRAGAVAWWISTTNQAAGTLQAVACGLTRSTGVTDGLWPPVEIDPTIYQLSDFPLTTRALHGGAFSVDTRTGGSAEQRLLIQLGYQSMIAAGATDDTGCGWLVEIYGDSFTTSLDTMSAVLGRATNLAVSFAGFDDQV